MGDKTAQEYIGDRAQRHQGKTFFGVYFAPFVPLRLVAPSYGLINL